jgi:hypothetical protein
MISPQVMSAISYNPQDVVGEMISPQVMSAISYNPQEVGNHFSYYILGII